jgi:hypothetical protein
VIRREFLELLRRLEEEFPVTSWKVRGIHVWPLVRLSLYSATFRSGSPAHSLSAGWRRSGINVVRGLGAWATARIGDRAANRGPGEPADAIFLGSSIGRRPLLEGKRYDVRAGPYVDLLGRLGARALVWEASPFGDYHVPRYTPSYFVQPRLMALRAVAQVFPLGPDAPILDRYDQFVAAVRDAGLGFAHADVARIRRDMLYIRLLADTFARWLRRSGARVGFVAGTGPQEQAFCLACRESGVTSVEVQHGVQGDLHPSYGSWFAVPEDGWETRAQVFWTWDAESAAAINRWASETARGHVAIVGGDPWREMWTTGEGELARRVDDRIREQVRGAGGARHILVTLSSQGDVMPAEVVEAIRASPADWRYWFRLHPVAQAERQKAARRILDPLGVSPQVTEFATEAPLHALLRHMDCHLSVSLSTVITEAAALGVPSVAIGREAPDFYRSELATGTLAVATTGPDLLDAIRRQLLRERSAPAEEEPRGLETMRRLLQGKLPLAEVASPCAPV